MVIGGLAQVVEKEREGTVCVDPEVINSELLRRKSSVAAEDLKTLRKLHDKQEMFVKYRLSRSF